MRSIFMSEEYFAMLRDGLEKAYALASEARSKGLDPSDDVEVRLAKDVAARVEGIVGPPGIADIIRNMEKQGMAREDIAFEIARKIAAGEVFRASREKLIEQAVRTGVGILTEGVLVAPTEGISKVRIRQNPDGSDFVGVYYAGPIRSAGGTAAALSLVLADIARKTAGVGDYRATDSQIERYVEEINVYESRVTHLQYMPPEKDLRHIIKNCPVCIDGDPTEEIEVSAYRGVPGVETDRVRGGVPLVCCEGVALKAAKLFKYTKKLKLGWDWLEDIIKIKKKADKIEIKPDKTYLDGLVAGRPVFAHASAKGGFRLRYGRSRTTGLMSKDIHPATMILLDGFLAYGTHMKIERPGKGCVIATHEGIEPPVAKLNDGTVMKVRTLEEAERIRPELKEVLFLGDMLCTYGDFLKSNHPLIPSGYCQEWWEKELEAAGVRVPPPMDAPTAFEFSRNNNVPLHPDYTYHWHDVSNEQLRLLVDWLKTGTAEFSEGKPISFALAMEEAPKRVLEEVLVEHGVEDGRVLLGPNEAFTVLSSLGMLDGEKVSSDKFDEQWIGEKGPLELINSLSGITIKAKAPTYIGARMGRPERAKERRMDGTPQVMFPTGSFKNRSLMKTYRSLKAREGEKMINLEVSRFRCPGCKALGFYRRCEVCGKQAKEEKVCQKCGASTSFDTHCDRDTVCYDRRPVNIVDMFDGIKARLGFFPEDVKGVRGLSNAMKIPERLEKGFLRSKHGIFVFRDGTSRFDATDITLTHFIPDEIGTSVEKLRELGYSEDYLGEPLTRGDQLVPLRHQDLLLSDSGGEYFLRVAKFIDEMLVNLYGLRAFYNVKTRDDLIGHLAVGLSPHTSAGALCRIIGFTRANVGYAHPYFHTVKRRNCFGGDESILVLKGGDFELLSMRELAGKYLIGELEKDDFGTEYRKVSGLRTFAFNRKSREFELADITHVSRSPAPEKMLRLRTKSGRSITLTPDHPLPDASGGKVNAGDAEKLLVPWKIDNPNTKEPGPLDFLSICDCEDLMIRTNEDVFAGCGQLSGLSRSVGVEYKTLTNYLYRKSYPLGLVRRFNPGLIRSGSYLLGSKRGRVSAKPAVSMDGGFFFLLGFYVAEGYMKRNQKGAHQVSITASKTWARKLLKEKIARVFGLHPSISGDCITMCSRLVFDLFDQLKIGKDARTKMVPGMVYSLTESHRNAFLRGYFSGDGSCSLGSTLEVNVTSVNKKLIDGVSYLLQFSSIRHSVSKESRQIKSDTILKFYGKPKSLTSYKIRIYGAEAEKFMENIGFIGQKHGRARQLLEKWRLKKRSSRSELDGGVFLDKVVEKTIVDSGDDYVYNLTVDKHHTLICSGVTAHQCDGDEDCLIMLMDALINFSRKYLNEKRGGTMDAPLVLSLEVNPKEVDDEVYCMEFVSSYPLEFYQAAEKIVPPGDVKLKTVKDVLGKPEQYGQLPLTHPGGYIDKGIIRTAYVQLESIPDKIEAEFSLQGRLRPVDSRDAAERLIMNHFVPDLYGNLRSYSRQTFRCVSCNTIFRRPPLAGKCSKCGGNLLLTINKGGIEKYLQIARGIAERFDLPDYLKQRLKLFGKELDSIFEDDKVKQTGLSDFL
ncbi:MAG: DNA polymerase II large subunit [Candidatus Micrarchaeota archaeon]